MASNECWEAIGPIQAYFKQVSEKIKECLRECGPPDDAIVTWSLYMIGRSRETAVPTILICSSKKAVRKAVRGLIEENRVLGQWISFGFQIGDCSIAPDQYRMPSSDHRVQHLSNDDNFTRATPNTVKLTGTSVWCTSSTIEPGMKVFFKQSSDCGKTRFATVGEIFSANGKYYTTTVGHLFAEESEQQTEEPVEFEFDIGGDKKCAGSPDFVVNIENSVAEYVADPPPWLGTVHKSQEDILESTAPLRGSNRKLIKIGQLVSVDTSSGLDYAVIEIDVGHIPWTKICHKPIHCVTTMAQTALRSPKIAAVITKTSSGGSINGRLSETPSFIRFPHGPEFREVWTVRFDQPLSKGDCGSMVVDSRTHQLCGHIVAGSPCSGVAYIVPAYEIFENIRRVLGGLQEIPRKDESNFSISTAFSWWPLSFGKQQRADLEPNLIIKRNSIRFRSFRYLLSRVEVADRVVLPDLSNKISERQMVLDSIDSSGFPWRVLIVAASGFFADSYCIFATNAMLPLLISSIYPEDTPHSLGPMLNVAALFGATIGQLFFGITADMWGRKKLYGLELVFIMLGVVGIVQTSGTGTAALYLVIFWRLFMGIGIGGAYPLSAIITAEFAPSNYRTRMMTIVSLAQPLGYLCVELVATLTARHALKEGDLGTKCESGVDRYLLDYLWRIVIGVGAFPALLAIVFRLSIPESPRFTMDVLHDIDAAADDVAEFYSKPSKRLEEKAPFSVKRSQSDEFIDGQKEATTKSHWYLVNFYYFISINGNWQYLVGTSLCWLLFDFAFYGLGLNAPRQISNTWPLERGAIDIACHSALNSTYSWEPPADSSSFLLQQASARIDIPIVGTLVGCFLVYFSVVHLARRNLQLFGFLGLFVTLLFLGVQFSRFGDVSQSPFVLFLFCLCRVFFNFGPNTTTFMLPAELFPTQYRGTAYGISAATGKIGSIVAQIILTEIETSTISPTSLVPNGIGRALLLLSAFMLIGAFITWQWVPEPQWSDQPGAVLGKWKSTFLSRWIGMKNEKEDTVGRCPTTSIGPEANVRWKD